MTRHALVLAAALCACLASPAPAQQAPSPSKAALHWFETFDLDKDGFVTAAEIRQASKSEFARLDANHDGKLTIDEYLAGSGDTPVEVKRTRARFEIMDRRGNSDGTVSPEEFVNFGLLILDVADSAGNHDGKLSRQEFIDSVTPEK
jgi:Ca2+-binding EF-hand superfamily protein